MPRPVKHRWHAHSHELPHVLSRDLKWSEPHALTVVKSPASFRRRGFFMPTVIHTIIFTVTPQDGVPAAR